MAIYGLSTVLVHSVGLITAPVFTRHFGPERYGVLEVMSAIVALAVTVLLGGFDVAVARSYFASSRLADRQTIVSTGFIAVVAAACTASVTAIVLSRPLADLVLDDRDLSGVVAGAAIGVPLTVAAGFTRRMMRLEGRAWLSLTSATLLAGGGAVSAVVLAVPLAMGLTGVYIGLAVGAAAAVVLNVVADRHLLRPRFSRRHLVAIAAIGLPLMPAALSTWALRMADRFLLLRWENLDQLGFYGVANRVANVVLLMTLSFDAAWMPFILKLHGEDPRRAARALAGALPMVVAAMAMLGVTVSAFTPELLAVVADDRFDPAVRLVPVLVVGLVLYATTSVTMAATVIAGRTGSVAVHAGIAAVINVVACLVLVPRWGITGAAWATVIAYTYQATAYYRRAKMLGEAQYPLRRVLGVLALSAPYLALGYLDVGGAWATAGLKVLAVSSLAAVLVMTRVIDTDDLRHLRMVGRRGR